MEEYFRLGYAPESWEALQKYLVGKKKYRREDLEKLGLVIRSTKGKRHCYDRFRGRIIFPIINMRQQIIGFGGRVIHDGSPKYLNSPETPIFRKGELLYGLNTAHRHIREM